MSSSTISDLIEEAGRAHWCTTWHCTTCGVTPWRAGFQRLARTPQQLVAELEQLPLSAWYDLPEFGGAIYYCFSVLHHRELVDQVLNNWLHRLDGHYRIADAVTFYVVREGQSSEGMRDDWLGRSEAMAVESRDPSLLESLVYAYGTRLREHPELLRAAESARRGHAALDRALKRMAEVNPAGT